VEGPASVSAFTLRIHNIASPSRSMTLAAQRHDFAAGQPWGFRRALRGSELAASLSAAGSLHISCSLRVVDGAPAARALWPRDQQARPAARPPAGGGARGDSEGSGDGGGEPGPLALPATVDTAAGIATLLGSELGDALSDVTLVSTDGERFAAHRVVLALASPALRALVAGGFAEGRGGAAITLPNASGGALRRLLGAAYGRGCSCADTPEELIELYALADQFGLDALAAAAADAVGAAAASAPPGEAARLYGLAAAACGGGGPLQAALLPAVVADIDAARAPPGAAFALSEYDAGELKGLLEACRLQDDARSAACASGGGGGRDGRRGGGKHGAAAAASSSAWAMAQLVFSWLAADPNVRAAHADELLAAVDWSRLTAPQLRWARSHELASAAPSLAALLLSAWEARGGGGAADDVEELRRALLLLLEDLQRYFQQSRRYAARCALPAGPGAASPGG